MSIVPPPQPVLPRPLLRSPVVLDLTQTEVALQPTPTAAENAQERLARRVAVVVPCFNRRDDAAAVLGDLAAVASAARARVDLRVVLVDNCSTEPLSTLATPKLSRDGKATDQALQLEHLRLDENTGGSGGYNRGIERVLSWWADPSQAKSGIPWDPEFVWLVDSDARVTPGTLDRLIVALDARPDAVAAGSAILDPLSGQAFELGGFQNIKSGHFEPMVLGTVGVDGPVEADYVAACCALVRSWAIRATGLMPDRFLNGDDVEWFIRMSAATRAGVRMSGELGGHGAASGTILAVPTSLAMHPRFDRFPTWTRYYTTRNAYGPLEAVRGGAPRRTLLKRAVRDTLRAVQQDIVGRHDLARLQIAGLRDAAAGRTLGPAPKGVIQVTPLRPFSALGDALMSDPAVVQAAEGSGMPRVRVHGELLISPSELAEVERQLSRVRIDRLPDEEGVTPSLVPALWSAVVRMVMGLMAGRWLPDVAIVPARGRPSKWFAGRTECQVQTGGFVLHRPNGLGIITAAVRTLARGLWYAVKLSTRPPSPTALEPVSLGPVQSARLAASSNADASPPSTPPMLLAVVILSYNRWAALRRTLFHLQCSPMFAPGGGGHRVVVVDNGSTDRTREELPREFPWVRFVPMNANLGVEAFNRGVVAAAEAGGEGSSTGAPEAVLILDDDAIVEPAALRAALELLAGRPELGAVTFHPQHPSSGASEWSFASAMARESGSCDDCPVMGCANLVRLSAWKAAGGYEARYFLYRNDTDLALRLLRMGWGVHFNPRWVVWHDTPAGAGGRKSARWHDLATRNWIWTARRHGRGWTKLAGILLGWAWAHRLAGLSLRRQISTLRGAAAGLVQDAPAWIEPCSKSTSATKPGAAFARLLGLHMQAGRRNSND